MKRHKDSQKRYYAFIDSQNLNLGIQNLGWKIDFKKFRIFLSDKLHVTKAIIFIGYVNKYRKLYKKLISFGYEIIFKPSIKIGKVNHKGNVDAELVLHSAKIEYSNYDKAIVVSGDGDFHCLLEDMVKENRLLKLMIPNKKAQSQLLKKFQNFKMFVENLREKIEKK